MVQHNINKTIVAVAAIVALAAVAAVWIWSSHNRYYLVNAMNATRMLDQHVYEIDKKTGRVWVVSARGRRLVPATPD
jgi:NADH:ubiquinone oxidoreductase subunit H